MAPNIQHVMSNNGHWRPFRKNAKGSVPDGIPMLYFQTDEVSTIFHYNFSCLNACHQWRRLVSYRLLNVC